MNRLHTGFFLLLLSAAVPLRAGASEPVRAANHVATVTLQDLVTAPERYAGKTLSVTGRYAGMCADGADFYFKDRLTTIEVLLPPNGMPGGLKIGTALRVQGQVQVRKESNGESEVRIKPVLVTINRAPKKKS